MSGGAIKPAVNGSKGGGDTIVVVGKGGAADPGAVPASPRPGVGSGGLGWGCESWCVGRGVCRCG